MSDYCSCMVVSSAYKSTKDIVSCNDKGRPLMKSKKNKGPKIDPWGTPQITTDEADNSLFIATH